MEFTSFDDLKNILGHEQTSSSFVVKNGSTFFVNKRKIIGSTIKLKSNDKSPSEIVINKDSQFLEYNRGPIMEADDSDEVQNAVELNTYIRNHRESLARYDKASHSGSDASEDDRVQNKDDDE